MTIKSKHSKLIPLGITQSGLAFDRKIYFKKVSSKLVGGGGVGGGGGKANYCMCSWSDD